MQHFLVVAMLALPVALALGLLVVPMRAQKVYWFVAVPLAVLAAAGVI